MHSLEYIVEKSVHSKQLFYKSDKYLEKDIEIHTSWPKTHHISYKADIQKCGISGAKCK